MCIRDRNSGESYQEGKQVASGSFTSGKEISPAIFNPLPSGRYRILVEAKDSQGRQSKNPVSYTHLKETIDGIIRPIIGNKEKGCLLLSPQKDNISFIICGPPGSGKTYIVKQMAKALGWPLVELSPSHFIKKGLDFIESTSREIFNDLYNPVSYTHLDVYKRQVNLLFETEASPNTHRTNNKQQPTPYYVYY